MKKRCFSLLIALAVMLCTFSVNIHANTTSDTDTKIEVIYVDRSITKTELEDKVQEVFDTTGAEIIEVNFMDTTIAPRGFVTPGPKENFKAFFYLTIQDAALITVTGIVAQLGNVNNYNCKVETYGLASLYSKNDFNTTSPGAYSIVKIKLGTAYHEVYTYKAPLIGTIALQ